MGTPFDAVARCEAKNVEPGKSTLWASIKIDPRGKALEAERAPLAIALVLDVSGSMQGDPIAHARQSCEIVADLMSPRDRLAIVTFADQAAILGGLVAMDDAGRAATRSALRDVRAGGQTNLHGGIGVAAGVLLQAPAGLRRVMVVMSDGQPNVGLASPSDLGNYIKTLGVSVSSLGFGLGHDENVLEAIATAGSGRYTYIADPRVARVELARAALAHGGIVADHLELRLRPALGVELLQIMPATPIRVGAFGLACAIGDVFIDEGRTLAVELALDLSAGANGRLAEIEIAGTASDGTPHQVNTALVVDIRTGPRVPDRDAVRDILLVRADVARAAARAQADRGALPAAVVILRDMAKLIDASPGFVRDDGSLLAELREQLDDEIANYERKSSDVERGHQRKAALAYNRGTPMYAPAQSAAPAVAAVLVRLDTGQRRALAAGNAIGRSVSNEFAIESSQLSRCHARILFTNGEFVLVDAGSTNGTFLNGKQVHTATTLHHADVIKTGDIEFRFELGVP